MQWDGQQLRHKTATEEDRGEDNNWETSCCLAMLQLAIFGATFVATKSRDNLHEKDAQCNSTFTVSPQLSWQKQIAHGNVNNDRNQKYFGKL